MERVVDVKRRVAVGSQSASPQLRSIAISRPALITLSSGTWRFASSGNVNCDDSRACSSESKSLKL